MLLSEGEMHDHAGAASSKLPASQGLITDQLRQRWNRAIFEDAGITTCILPRKQHAYEV